MKKSVLLMLCMAVSISVLAQKQKITSGDLNFLSGQKNFNVEFDYSNLKLLKDNLPEAEYIENRSNELNEKSDGNGDTWRQKWESAKSGIWETKFMESLRKGTNKKGATFKQGLEDAKYTLVVDVVWIYPGWDAAVMKQPAKVTTVLRFVETDNRDNVLVEVSSKDAPGDQWGNNFSNESRIGEGFAKTAKTFAGLIAKKL